MSEDGQFTASTGYVVANGIRIFYFEAGTGPLVLLLHGFPESWYSWRHQIPALAHAGFRAVAIDLPGYGRSDKPDVTYDIEFLSATIAGVIEGLGHRQAVVVGHDWGGLIVWPFARMYAERTAGVIGLNTPDLHLPMPPLELFKQMNGVNNYIVEFQPRYEVEDRAYATPEGIETFLRAFYTGWATTHPEVFTDEVVETYVADFRAKGALTPPLEYYRNMDRNWELTRDHINVKIEVPCLMIMASNDPVLRPDFAEGMEDRVPNLEKVLIEDCGHWTQQEKPEETSRAMLTYLKTLDAWD